MANLVSDIDQCVMFGWMKNALGLKGLELQVYAIIFQSSQIKEQWFCGSLEYLAEWCNCSEETIKKVLKSLLDKGYIIQGERYIENDVILTPYSVSHFVLDCIFNRNTK